LIIMKATATNAAYIFTKAYAKGLPVIFPTDTIYGMGASFWDTQANISIYDIKGRDEKKPFPVLVGDFSQLKELGVHVSEKNKRILRRYWPGPFTFILRTSLNNYDYAVKDGKIAVRLPSIAWLQALLIKLDFPITATSANVSGNEYVDNFNKIFDSFHKSINFFLYKKSNGIKTVSTIVDLSNDNAVILRNPMDLKQEDFL